MSHGYIDRSTGKTSKTLNTFVTWLLELCVDASFSLTTTLFQMYLSQFGYLNPALRNSQTEHIISEDSFSKAIQEFQSFAGINITGKSRTTLSMVTSKLHLLWFKSLTIVMLKFISFKLFYSSTAILDHQ